MKFFGLKSLCSMGALLALGACDAGVTGTANQVESPIINGEVCSIEDEPTTVAVLLDASLSFPGFGEQEVKAVQCTGTLIAPDVVLTAAHCLDASAQTLGFGTVEREAYGISFQSDLSAVSETLEFPADTVMAAGWVVHEEFSLDSFSGEGAVNGPGNFYDIGLIFLDTALETTPEVVVTAEEMALVAEGDDVSIAGWGQQIPTDGPFDPPPEGSVGIKVCAEAYINEIGDFEFQVGDDESTSRKCHGDSGGPTFITLDTPFDNDRRVIGITSHAYDQSDCAKGGVDTRVDVWLDWMEEKMVGACDEGTRVWCDVEGVIPASFYEGGNIGEGEGEGETGEGEGEGGEGEGEGEAPDDCSSTAVNTTGLPGALALVIGLFGLAIRRRR